MRNSYEPKPRLSPINYLLLVSDVTGIRSVDILAKNKKKEVVEARQICMFFYKQKIGIYWAGLTLNKSHSTVSHGYNTVQGLLEVEDKRTLDFVLQIKNLEENGKLT